MREFAFFFFFEKNGACGLVLGKKFCEALPGAQGHVCAEVGRKWTVFRPQGMTGLLRCWLLVGMCLAHVCLGSGLLSTFDPATVKSLD